MRIAARRRPIRAALVVSLITALSLMATTGLALADASGQPKGITGEANKMHDLYLLVLALGGVVYLAVEAPMVFLLIRYRRKKARSEPTATYGAIHFQASPPPWEIGRNFRCRQSKSFSSEIFHP